jgi:type VI secretion system protein ImpE
MQAERWLREGKLEEALQALQEQVRSAPGDAKLRVFLFQVLLVLGQWDRALKQLQVSASLDAAAVPMAQTYRELIGCELFRAEVFAGKRSPSIFGEPEPWMAPVLRAIELTAQGEHSQAEALRSEGFELAPATPCQVDGKACEWLADADSRLGPLLEVVVRGRYFLMPFSRLSSIHLDAPKDLRDVVWAPAQLFLTSGTELVGFIPARYVGSEASEDDAVKLGRKTLWQEQGEATFTGLGQRMLTSDQGDVALLDVRRVEFSAGAEREAGPSEGEHA